MRPPMRLHPMPYNLKYSCLWPSAPHGQQPAAHIFLDPVQLLKQKLRFDCNLQKQALFHHFNF